MSSRREACIVLRCSALSPSKPKLDSATSWIANQNRALKNERISPTCYSTCIRWRTVYKCGAK